MAFTASLFGSCFRSARGVRFALLPRLGGGVRLWLGASRSAGSTALAIARRPVLADALPFEDGCGQELLAHNAAPSHTPRSGPSDETTGRS